MGSRCSSNRTSGISLGYDTRHTPQQQFSSLQTGGSTAGQGYMGAGRAGVASAEGWRDYLDGVPPHGAHDSRHSYPPAVGSPAAACYRAGPEWWDGEQRAVARGEESVAGERARYSDLPGTRYQEELTRLLLRDAMLEGEGLLGGLKLKEQATPIKALAKPVTLIPASAGGPIKAQEETGPGREGSENRQEFFGEIINVFITIIFIITVHFYIIVHSVFL